MGQHEPPLDTSAATEGIMDIDLSNERRLTFALLDDTRAWRERAIHEFVLRDSDHVEASVAYQVRIPLELIRRHNAGARTGDEARLLLPFTIRPKELLLDVDFQGADKHAVTLLQRREIAALQAEYLAHVDGRSLHAQPLGGDLWVGVSAMTTFEWLRQLDEASPRRWGQRHRVPGDESRITALTAFLNADLDFSVHESEVVKWCQQIEPARQALIEALGEGEDPASASECILLAIPFMSFKPTDASDIDALVDEFCAAIGTMNLKAREVLAEYGRRWEVLVDTVVPIGRACAIKLHELHPWVDAPQSTMRQELVFGDAATTHVEIRSADHGVVLDAPAVEEIAGVRRDLAVCDAIRPTADAVAIYASDPTRPYFASVSVRAKIRSAHLWVIISILVLIGAAFVVAAVLPEDENLVESLTLLTFPLTLAGVVVLSREPTPLAERLLQRWRYGLMFAIAGLWLLTLARLLADTGVPWLEPIWTHAQDAASCNVQRGC